MRGHGGRGLGFNLGYERGEVAFGWTSLARCRLSDRFAAFMSNDAKAEARTHTRAKGADRCNAMRQKQANGGEPGSGADVAAVSPVPVQMWRADVAGASPVAEQMWQR